MTLTPQAELARIDEINAAIAEQGLNWVAGKTPISNLSLEDKASLYGVITGARIAGIGVESCPIRIQADDFPTKFDWRDHEDVDGVKRDWMTSVKSQECGDCWAHSAIGAVEAAFNIYSGHYDLNLDLSEQHLVSTCCNAGDCGGGELDWGLGCIKRSSVHNNYGVSDDECFPYEGRNSECTPCSDWREHRYVITGFIYIEPTIEAFKYALMTYGPMCVALNHGDDWFYYTSGVYSPTGITPMGADHGVILVGWDDDVDGWICKNSHGIGFGEEGYALVAYGVLEGYHDAHAITGIVYDDAVHVLCDSSTANFCNGCKVLLHYDDDKDGIISATELSNAANDLTTGTITQGEYDFVVRAHDIGSIDLLCEGCYEAWTTPLSATASSTYHDAFAPDNAIDGNVGSYWKSRYDGTDPWIEFDVGELVVIDKVRVLLTYQSTPIPVTVNVRTSSDGVNWTTVNSAYTITEHSTLLTIPLARTEGRYIRIYYDKQGACAIFEVCTNNDCTAPTTNFSSGCGLLNYHDTNQDGIIDASELLTATNSNLVNTSELDFIKSANAAGSINAVCPGCSISEVANIVATEIIVTPTACDKPCEVSIDITWENVGSAGGSFRRGYTIDGTWYGDISDVYLIVGASTREVFYTIFDIAGSYTICPSPR